ncbi:Gem-associated protein 5 [Eumeta japonica]|uniref:Gem-associated protein 5 n=1 Tax=Eumeta variegata TaxID=151549 RepID=A0A4C1SPM3_EUMVA|nr:Gem-associated protein 5 [Eumeta japonica]
MRASERHASLPLGHGHVDSLTWGGLTYKRAVTLLALHEVGAAVELLLTNGMYKEAYVLCRARHLNSLADGALQRWAEHERFASHYTAAAACYLALGDVEEAAAVLGKSTLEEHLQLAAEMARFAGHATYAAHVADKGEKIRVERESNPDLQLPKLPTRAELLESVRDKSLLIDSE